MKSSAFINRLVSRTLGLNSGERAGAQLTRAIVPDLLPYSFGMLQREPQTLNHSISSSSNSKEQPASAKETITNLKKTPYNFVEQTHEVDITDNLSKETISTRFTRKKKKNKEYTNKGSSSHKKQYKRGQTEQERLSRYITAETELSGRNYIAYKKGDDQELKLPSTSPIHSSSNIDLNKMASKTMVKDKSGPQKQEQALREQKVLIQNKKLKIGSTIVNDVDINSNRLMDIDARDKELGQASANRDATAEAELSRTSYIAYQKEASKTMVKDKGILMSPTTPESQVGNYYEMNKRRWRGLDSVRQGFFEPTITISIGHIEIRAINPSSFSSNSSTKSKEQRVWPPQPKMSLQEYLKFRDQGWF